MSGDATGTLKDRYVNGTINSASQWRRAVAQRLAPIYAANPRVAAVMLGGSTARGHADRFSDIEIGVFWHQPPTGAERRAAVDQARADLLRLYPYDPIEEVWSDDLSVTNNHSKVIITLPV
jgi:predicted nucleotidyltransferase